MDTLCVLTGQWEASVPMLQARSVFGLNALQGQLYALGGHVGDSYTKSVEVTFAKVLPSQWFKYIAKVLKIFIIIISFTLISFTLTSRLLYDIYIGAQLACSQYFLQNYKLFPTGRVMSYSVNMGMS